MKKTSIVTIVCVFLLLTGCGLFKQKAAGYYLDKARAAAQKQNLTPAEADAAFAQIEKSCSYAPGSAQAVTVLEDLAEAAVKSGYAKAQELELNALKKMIAADAHFWPAREALINFLAARGDVSGLADEAINAERIASGAGKGEPGVRYCALLAQLAATASAAPWIASEASLNVNKSPSAFFEKAGIYSSAVAKSSDLRKELEKLAATDPTLKQAAPAELVSAAEVAAADALKDPDEIDRAQEFNERVEAEPAFKRAVDMTVQGNTALVAKDYTKARAFYQGALAQYPGLMDARRQLAEVDFQEGVRLAAVGESKKEANLLLGRAYAGVNSVIKDSVITPNYIPFLKRDKFLGETYALKAATLSAMRAVEGPKLKKPTLARLEKEFKASLDEALKLSPEGRLARELLERYTKEGF
ncbi:MAG TPA: hypothetical protein DCZ92_07075 [Elusimicrobia bacterium]|nr:MAG: hypothetical protein A2016_04890 [Elusimicrobia bacterium GWF2_62_30]HBA60568.1 hypothetical protein [Elusimicrobiota bacterium]